MWPTSSNSRWRESVIAACLCTSLSTVALSSNTGARGLPAALPGYVAGCDGRQAGLS